MIRTEFDIGYAKNKRTVDFAKHNFYGDDSESPSNLNNTSLDKMILNDTSFKAESPGMPAGKVE